jgi:hypothetical protein
LSTDVDHHDIALLSSEREEEKEGKEKEGEGGIKGRREKETARRERM